MEFTLIISDNCESCERAKKTITEVLQNNSSINLKTIHQENFSSKPILITPALIIDDVLFSYGDIDTDKLFKKIKGA